MESAAGGGARLGVVVDGMGALFWSSKRARGGKGDLGAALVRALRGVARAGAVVVASKAVLFPKKSPFDDMLGSGWRGALTHAVAVEATTSAPGKTGARMAGSMFAAEGEKTQFHVERSGLVFR